MEYVYFGDNEYKFRRMSMSGAVVIITFLPNQGDTFESLREMLSNEANTEVIRIVNTEVAVVSRYEGYVKFTDFAMTADGTETYAVAYLKRKDLNEQLADLRAENKELNATIDEIMTEVIPALLGEV